MGASGPLTSPRVILLSSDAFGLPVMRALHDAGWLVGVIAQPDRPRGRGRKLEPVPTKAEASALAVPVLTPERVAADEARAWIAALNPDFLVIASYAQYLPKSVRDLPRIACLNIHPSLLPKYRGPAPIVGALWQGERVTGVTIHYTAKGIDTGDILAVEELPIKPLETHGELEPRLATVSAELLLPLIGRMVDGEIAATPQDESRATMTRMLTPADRECDFTLPAAALMHHVLALSPEPGAVMRWGTDPVLVLHAQVCPDDLGVASPGTVKQPGRGRLAIGTADGWLELLEILPPGKRPMAVRDWLNGLKGGLPECVASGLGDPRPFVVPIAEVALLKPALPALDPGLEVRHG